MGERINLNTAEVGELTNLPGVGSAMAAELGEEKRLGELIDIYNETVQELKESRELIASVYNDTQKDLEKKTFETKFNLTKLRNTKSILDEVVNYMDKNY